MRGASSLALLLCVVACGHVVPIGDDTEIAPTGITETDAGSTTALDASIAPVTPHVRCDPAAAFGALTPVTLPSLPLDLDLFRASSGGGGVISLFDNGTRALRSIQLAGDAVTNVGSLGSAYDDKTLDQASLSADGRTLFLTRTKDNSDSDLLFARRSSVDQAFPAPTPISHAGLVDALFAPYFAGRRLYFSHVPKHVIESLMVADFDPIAGTLSNATDLSSLALAVGARWSPVVTQDELEIFFARSFAVKDAQVMHATRPNANTAFGAPVPVVSTPAGGVGSEYPTWISDDACTLWVVSNRGESPAVLMRAKRD